MNPLDAPFTNFSGKELADSLQHAYLEGRVRFAEGWSLKRNPFAGEHAQQWARGWYDAQKGIDRTL